MKRVIIIENIDKRGIIASGGKGRIYYNNNFNVVLDRYETVINYGEFTGESGLIKEFVKEMNIIN